MREIRYAAVNGKEIPVLISDENEALLAARAAGGAIVGLWSGEGRGTAAPYAVEALSDVTEEFLERAARRHLGLPWRICETRRLLVRDFLYCTPLMNPGTALPSYTDTTVFSFSS